MLSRTILKMINVSNGNDNPFFIGTLSTVRCVSWPRLRLRSKFQPWELFENCQYFQHAIYVHCIIWTYFHLFPDCLQLNHDYHTGPNLPSTFAGVPSLYQCQQLCLEDPKCLTFAVVHNSQDCVLKSGGDAFSISSSDYDVGKRVCEGERMFSSFISKFKHYVEITERMLNFKLLTRVRFKKKS